jgi:uncharacterized membrane protein YciS (DUF1049 family)
MNKLEEARLWTIMAIFFAMGFSAAWVIQADQRRADQRAAISKRIELRLELLRVKGALLDREIDIFVNRKNPENFTL